MTLPSKGRESSLEVGSHHKYRYRVLCETTSLGRWHRALTERGVNCCKVLVWVQPPPPKKKG